ncbi:MAPEG family protein [Roseovarius litorisediminis]|uniref:MAPEG family protein n=1 Tax=Roseovarius litorisediminis TaxID=1312363 RepID=A0A1Y5SIP8_9RHOB|nr:MAPEG family protein [Roseovarius litorisediminis]SLN41739.1 MAPEG family protein [Roseovarius litorisediminis]
MVFWILAAMALYLVNVYMAGLMLFARIGPVAYSGPRDSLPEPGVYRARTLKAAANFAENLPVFLGLGLLALVVNGADLSLATLGAEIFVLSRIVYIAVYIAGVPLVRSVIFTFGLIGMGMMAWALV